MRLHEFALTGRRRKKRLGRGNASGRGTYSGRGVKGQKARAGARIRSGFEGGQTPVFQRLPKRRGFRSLRPRPFPVNVRLLEASFPAGALVDIRAVRNAGLVPPGALVVKILGDGELTKPLTVKLPVSKEAKAKIENAGGTVVEATGRRSQAVGQNRT